MGFSDFFLVIKKQLLSEQYMNQTNKTVYI